MTKHEITHKRVTKTQFEIRGKTQFSRLRAVVGNTEEIQLNWLDSAYELQELNIPTLHAARAYRDILTAAIEELEKTQDG